jgi:hypothetical protein
MTSSRRYLPIALATATVASLWLLTAPAADAASGLIDRLSPACRDQGLCDFCDALDGFVILTRWIIGFSGSIALALFVWFGFRFIISAGKSEVVQGAKRGLVGTALGLAIVLAAWEIINFTLLVAVTPSATLRTVLRDPQKVGQVALFSGSSPWYQYCPNRAKPRGRIPGITETTTQNQ